jgi:hypothetical protein
MRVDAMTTILDLFRSPSSYPDDARAWLRNQVGHTVAVGIMSAILLLQFGLPQAWLGVIPAVYAVWEWAQWRWQGATVSDCADDEMFVSLGVALVATGSPWIAMTIGLALVSGYQRRQGR